MTASSLIPARSMIVLQRMLTLSFIISFLLKISHSALSAFHTVGVSPITQFSPIVTLFPITTFWRIIVLSPMTTFSPKLLGRLKRPMHCFHGKHHRDAS